MQHSTNRLLHLYRHNDTVERMEEGLRRQNSLTLSNIHAVEAAQEEMRLRRRSTTQNAVQPDHMPDEVYTQASIQRDTLRSEVSQFDTNLPREKYNKSFLKLSKVVFVVVLFSAVLAAVTMSKVTFVAIASKLYENTGIANVTNSTTEEEKNLTSITFVQLVILLMTPQLVTVIRMFFSGIVGKGQKNYPWPSLRSMFAVGLMIELEGEG